jgi:hypothetical protein
VLTVPGVETSEGERTNVAAVIAGPNDVASKGIRIPIKRQTKESGPLSPPHQALAPSSSPPPGSSSSSLQVAIDEQKSRLELVRLQRELEQGECMETCDGRFEYVEAESGWSHRKTACNSTSGYAQLECMERTRKQFRSELRQNCVSECRY